LNIGLREKVKVIKVKISYSPPCPFFSLASEIHVLKLAQPYLFAGLNMSICFNKLMAAGSAAGYNDSKLLPGFLSRL